MRQIDADKLWEVLRGEEGAKALNHSLVELMEVKQIIDNAPTIEAIPVEWLKACGKRGSIIWVIADILIERWQKEQEAR